VRPELFSLLGTGFPSYFVLLLSGFLFATIIAALWARRVGDDPDRMIDLGLAMLLSGIVGARLLHVFADGYFWDYVHLCTDPSQVDWKIPAQACSSALYDGVWDTAKQVCHPKTSDCFAWARFSGGLTYYGGFFAAVAVAVWLTRRDGLVFWKVADMAGFTIPLGLAFGRMGCLLAGCCFGIRHARPLGLVFPAHSPASDSHYKLGLLSNPGHPSLPVLPTQLYESVACLLIGLFCLGYLHSRKRYHGQVFLTFVGLYAVVRFLLEWLRSDDRGGIGGLSTSQWIGVVLLLASIAAHRWRRAIAASFSATLPTPDTAS